MVLTYSLEECEKQITTVTGMFSIKKSIKDRKQKQEFRNRLKVEYDKMLLMYKTYLIETDDYGFRQKYKIAKLKALRLSI